MDGQVRDGASPYANRLLPALMSQYPPTPNMGTTLLTARGVQPCSMVVSQN